MSVTIQSIVDTISNDLMEPTISGTGPGLLTGTFTQQQILDLIGTVLMDFVSSTGMTKGIFSEMLNAGVFQYPVPDQMVEVTDVFINAKYLDQEDQFSERLLGQWQRKQSYPEMWHMDGIPVKTIEIVPAPNWDGVPPNPSPPQPPYGVWNDFQAGGRNLTMVGPVIPQQEVWGIGDTISGIPDSFTVYLVYGVLEKIFTNNAETKDEQRAAYCHSRYEEGVALGKSILLEYSLGESQ